jgi:hypothetical protein
MVLGPSLFDAAPSMIGVTVEDVETGEVSKAPEPVALPEEPKVDDPPAANLGENDTPADTGEGDN